MLTFFITFRIKPNWCKEMALTTSETLGKAKYSKQAKTSKANKLQGVCPVIKYYDIKYHN